MSRLAYVEAVVSTTSSPSLPTSSTIKSLGLGVVVGLVGHAVLLVGTVQAVARLGQLLVLARLRREVHRHPVVAVLVDDADHAEVNLVHLESRLVLVDVPEWAFPLAASQAVEAPVLQTLQALIAQCSLDVVELRQRVAVQFVEFLSEAFPSLAYSVS